VVVDARGERGSGRVECQTLFCTSDAADQRFEATGFSSRRRHYMRRDLRGPLRVKARVAEASIDGDSLPDARQHFLAGLEFLGLAALDGVRVRSFVDAEWRRRRGAHPAPS
jgi:hypothetical protein